MSETKVVDMSPYNDTLYRHEVVANCPYCKNEMILNHIFEKEGTPVFGNTFFKYFFCTCPKCKGDFQFKRERGFNIYKKVNRKDL